MNTPATDRLTLMETSSVPLTPPPPTPPAKVPTCGHSDKKVFARGVCRGCYKKLLRQEKRAKKLEAAASEVRYAYKILFVNTFEHFDNHGETPEDYETRLLNKEGQNGWELAGAISETDGPELRFHYLYLKKRIVPERINPPKGEGEL